MTTTTTTRCLPGRTGAVERNEAEKKRTDAREACPARVTSPRGPGRRPAVIERPVA